MIQTLLQYSDTPQVGYTKMARKIRAKGGLAIGGE